MCGQLSVKCLEHTSQSSQGNGWLDVQPDINIKNSSEAYNWLNLSNLALALNTTLGVNSFMNCWSGNCQCNMWQQIDHEHVYKQTHTHKQNGCNSASFIEIQLKSDVAVAEFFTAHTLSSTFCNRAWDFTQHYIQGLNMIFNIYRIHMISPGEPWMLFIHVMFGPVQFLIHP